MRPADYSDGDHGHRGRQQQGLRRQATAAATPAIACGSLAGGDTAAFSETFDTKNAGTGKTLTAAGSVSDGNGGNNYTVSFVTNATGRSRPGRSPSRRPPANDKNYDGSNHGVGRATVTCGSLAGGDTAVFSETFDTRNAGTGKTLRALVRSMTAMAAATT